MQNYKAFVHYQSNIVLLHQVLKKVKKIIKNFGKLEKLPIFAVPKTWPVRLSVRTNGFHPLKRGSTPLRATKPAMLLVF